MRLAVADQVTGVRAVAVKAVLRLLTVRGRTYQPVVVGGKAASAGRRLSDDRLTVVLETAADVGAATVLDLGCAEGYMVRRCAEAGYLSVGVDADAKRLLSAQMSLTVDGVAGFGFIRSAIDLDTLPRLPKSDVVVCLSLLHHVIYEHGLAYGGKMLATIREMTGRALVFEMGRSDETGFAWAAELPDMGPDPDGWVADLLREAGFVRVVKAAEVVSFNSTVPRATFVAHVA